MKETCHVVWGVPRDVVCDEQQLLALCTVGGDFLKRGMGLVPLPLDDLEAVWRVAFLSESDPPIE